MRESNEIIKTACLATVQDGNALTTEIDKMAAGTASEISARAIALAELEFALSSVNQALQRWMIDSVVATPLKELAFIDIVVLHYLNDRPQDNRLADICFMLNIEDMHVVTYALRKLVNAGAVVTHKNSKEVTYSITPLAQESLAAYGQVREQHLIRPLHALYLDKAVLRNLARFLHRICALYDQAARAASRL